MKHDINNNNDETLDFIFGLLFVFLLQLLLLEILSPNRIIILYDSHPTKKMIIKTSILM